MRMYFKFLLATATTALYVSTSLAQQNTKETVGVGPWSITTTYRANRFENCTMSRTGDEINASFVLTKDEMLLDLDSAKWHLERGKAYQVKLAIGSRLYDAKAVAEIKTATIALGDRSLNEALRAGATLDVQGEGATIRVPLDGSAAAFDRLTACVNKNLNSSAEANPFVAPDHKP
jgi:hypothetical protein